ncbi:NGN domain-containing protein [Trichonephila clavipes]|nr:NGN domain-containing protein [Trichonephila clavipes]
MGIDRSVNFNKVEVLSDPQRAIKQGMSIKQFQEAKMSLMKQEQQKGVSVEKEVLNEGLVSLYHSPKAYQQILAGFERLSVTHYTPKLTVITKRADSKTSVRINKRPLFPAYLFVYFDPEVVHTTKITQLIGVNEFVKIAAKCGLCRKLLSTACATLSLRKLIKSDQSVSYSNVPDDLMAKLEEINGAKRACEPNGFSSSVFWTGMRKKRPLVFTPITYLFITADNRQRCFFASISEYPCHRIKVLNVLKPSTAYGVVYVGAARKQVVENWH